jgi:hypothetical protein
MSGFGRRAAVLSVLFVAASAGTAQQESSMPGNGVPGDPVATHEELDYSVEWRLIPAGTAQIDWTATPHSAAAASELKMHLQSTGLVSRLFHVDDQYLALMNQHLCAQRTEMMAHEGSRNRETYVAFDPQLHLASHVEKDLNRNTTVTQEVEIPPCVHDVLGGLLLLRNMKLEPGTAAQIPVSDGKKFAQVRVESQRREDLVTPLGPRKTIRYEVFVFDNVLYKRSGHLHIWLTDDSRRLPVQLQVRLQFTIGTITFRLSKDDKS